MSIQVLVRGVSVDREFSTAAQLVAMAADQANEFMLCPVLPRVAGAMVEQSESRLERLNWPKSTPLVVAYVAPLLDPPAGEALYFKFLAGEALYFKFLAGVERPMTLGDQDCHLVAIVGRDNSLVDRVALELSAFITNKRAEAVTKG